MSQATLSSNQSNSYVFEVTSLVGWAKPNHSNTCVVCGRKVGKNSFFVHLSIYGTVIPVDYKGDSSQGFWEVGSECAKKFNPKLLTKLS